MIFLKFISKNIKFIVIIIKKINFNSIMLRILINPFGETYDQLNYGYCLLIYIYPYPYSRFVEKTPHT